MGKDLFDTRKEAREVFDTVAGATGVDIRKLCFDTEEETLRQTENAQIALYTCGVAAYRCLNAHFQGVVQIDAFAGHSVGEYAALAAANVVTIEDGGKLVQRRGELMSAAGKETPGTMAAVLGLDRVQIEKLLGNFNGKVVVANDNCPGQIVISGEVNSVEKASALLAEAGAKRVLPLNVSGAFHSPLMESSATEMRKLLDATTFKSGGRVISNVTAQPVVQESKWPELLERQLKSPVRWTETIENLINEDVRTYIECGVGDVLSGLIKRITKEAKSYRVNDTDSLESTIAALRA